MPRISQFRGIDISMYYNDHAPPHFHAEHGDDEAVIDIMNLTVIDGSLPSKLLKLVLQWAGQHQQDLLDDWQLARARRPLQQITPLS